MAEQQVPVTEVNDPLLKARNFGQKFQKPLIGIAAALVLIIGGWFVYKKMFKEPAEERAADAIFKAEQYFGMDSLRLALNGDGQNKGFLNVIKSHSGTKSANLANFYAGV